MAGPTRADRLPLGTVRRLIGFALLVSAAAGVLAWGRLSPFRQVDAFFYDAFVRLGVRGGSNRARGAENSVAAVAVVDIDDNSLSEVGQWPWPRYRLAQLMAAIHAGGPSAIGVDVLFPEPDRTALSALRKAYREELGIDLGVGNVPPGLMENDTFFGAVLGEVGAVGSIQLLFDQTNTPAVALEPPPGILLAGETGRLDLLRAPGLLVNTFRIQAQMKFCGFLNAKPDEDGRVRRMPLLLRQADRVYPHLLLATLMRAAGTDTVTVAHDRLGPLLRVGPHTIPVNADGTMLLRYSRAAPAYPSISALDVLRSRGQAGGVAGKVVFVGSSASALNDLVATPVDPQFPGLKVHATASENILTGDYMRAPEWSGPASLLLGLACGGVIAALFVRSGRLLVLVPGSAALLAVVVLASGVLAIRTGVYVNPSAGVVAILLSFMFLSVARQAIERRRAFASLELVSETQRVTIESMAAVAETRDRETGGHIKRTQRYVTALARELVLEGKYVDLLTPEYVNWLGLSAPLHDIGKVGVRDAILLKAGRLEESDFQQMKEHTRFGREIIEATSRGISGDNFLRIAGEMAGCHHEKWDGTGYPHGLAGEAIPLAARLMSVADVYDALVSARRYKVAMPHEEARNMLVGRRGRDFDPAVVDAFVAIEQEVVAIARLFADDDGKLAATE